MKRAFAVPPTLRGYKRGWLSGDLLAALTLLVIAVPEQLATSRLAGMPPVTGFYAFAAGSAVFALLGSSGQMSVGADSTIAPLFAVAVARLAAPASVHYDHYIAVLSVLVGLILAGVWVLRLGAVAEFLSLPIITGFLAGVGIVIIVHQLPDLLGLPSGAATTLGRLHHVVQHLGAVNGWTAAIGIAVFLVVIVVERIDRKIPVALLALVVSSMVTALAGLRGHGVKVLGHFAHGAPQLGLSGLSTQMIGQLLPLAAIVALVIVIQSAVTARAFAGDTQPDVGRDLMAVGTGNVIAGLVGAFPVNASPARTAAVADAGGRTQLTGLLSAVVIVALIPLAGVLHDVPLATLAGVLLFVASRLFHFGELTKIARFDRFEFALTVITLLAVALIGVEQGIGVAVALAILDRTRISAQPRLHVLERLSGTTSWAPPGPGTEATPGVLVVLFATPLWYANASHFGDEARAAIVAAKPPPKVVVLDALGMSDIDYTGTQAMAALLDELQASGTTFAIARAGHRVREELRRAGLLERIGETRLFPTVGAAVQVLEPTR